MGELPHLVNALLYAVAGIALFLAAFAILVRMVPGDLWKQILEQQNKALAILLGAICLGLCLIISAAVH